MDFILSILITGVFYMILPIVYVKSRGKTTSSKAFWLAFLNWIIIHAIFLYVYNTLFPDDTNVAISTAPGIWLFVAWWCMRDLNKSGNEKAKSKKIQTDSIEDLENKFNISFKNARRQVFKREKAKYAVLIFDFNDKFSRFDELRAIIVANSKINNYRYFTIESPFDTSYTLYERKFDKHNKENRLLSYGSIDLNKLGSLSSKENGCDEVLIDRIHSIITMKAKPQMSWSGKGLIWMNKSLEEKRLEIVEETNPDENDMNDFYAKLSKIVREKLKPDNEHKEAVRLYQNQNTRKEAIDIFTKLAETGYAKSQSYLARYLFYENINKEEAIKWWEKAASQGDEEAVEELNLNMSKLVKTDSKSNMKELVDELNKELLKSWSQEARNEKKSVDEAIKLKFYKMFGQSFSNCFSFDKLMINNISCIHYQIMPSTDVFVGKIRTLIETLDYPKRYLVAEYSFDSAILLCEWLFNDQNVKFGHYNYGPIVSDMSEWMQFSDLFLKKVEEILSNTKRPDLS